MSLALDVGLAAASLDGGLLAGDINGTVVFLGDLEDSEGIEGRGVFDVAGLGVEASWGKDTV